MAYPKQKLLVMSHHREDTIVIQPCQEVLRYRQDHGKALVAFAAVLNIKEEGFLNDII